MSFFKICSYYLGSKGWTGKAIFCQPTATPWVTFIFSSRHFDTSAETQRLIITSFHWYKILRILAHCYIQVHLMKLNLCYYCSVQLCFPCCLWCTVRHLKLKIPHEKVLGGQCHFQSATTFTANKFHLETRVCISFGTKPHQQFPDPTVGFIPKLNQISLILPPLN